MYNVLIVLLKIFLKDLFLRMETVIGLMYYPKKIKQYNNRVHVSTKLTPIQASSKENEGFVYKKLLDKVKKIEPKFQVIDLVRKLIFKTTFSKGHTTNLS